MPVKGSIPLMMKLQEKGLGNGREMGFGIFLPHKGIEAVKKIEDDGEK